MTKPPGRGRCGEAGRATGPAPPPIRTRNEISSSCVDSRAFWDKAQRCANSPESLRGSSSFTRRGIEVALELKGSKAITGTHRIQQGPLRQLRHCSFLPLPRFLSFVHYITIFHFSYWFSSILLNNVLIVGVTDR